MGKLIISVWLIESKIIDNKLSIAKGECCESYYYA